MTTASQMAQQCSFSMAELPCLIDHRVEGTPFVPMAVLIDQLARQLDVSHPFTLSDVKVKMPVMLRKNRVRTLLAQAVGGKASLMDDAASVYVSADLEQPDSVSASNSATSMPAEPSQRKLPREEIYPSLLFHGPTFQADFQICRFNETEAEFIVTGFNLYNASLGRFHLGQKIPIVLADIAFQATGMHLMAEKDHYALPATCRSMTVERLPRTGEAIIRSKVDAEGLYDIMVSDLNGNPLFQCVKLGFTKVARQIEPEKKVFLQSLCQNREKEKFHE